MVFYHLLVIPDLRPNLKFLLWFSYHIVLFHSAHTLIHYSFLTHLLCVPSIRAKSIPNLSYTCTSHLSISCIFPNNSTHNYFPLFQFTTLPYTHFYSLSFSNPFRSHPSRMHIPYVLSASTLWCSFTLSMGCDLAKPRPCNFSKPNVIPTSSLFFIPNSLPWLYLPRSCSLHKDAPSTHTPLFLHIIFQITSLLSPLDVPFTSKPLFFHVIFQIASLSHIYSPILGHAIPHTPPSISCNPLISTSTTQYF